MTMLLWAGCTACRPSGQEASISRIDEITQRGTLLVGATGDYRPLSYFDPQTREYWGLDVDLAEIIAHDLGVRVEFVPTSWPTLTDDMLDPTLFDVAMCGISITDARQQVMLMSDGYLRNGKTILCRADEAYRYTSLADIDQPDVVVMINPGGTNEKFAHDSLTHAQIVVHQRNEEIPSLIAEGKADIMITEVVEASYYVRVDNRLAAPLVHEPFTHSQMGVLMRQGDDELLERVNAIIDSCRTDGTLLLLHQKYGLAY